MPIPLRERMAKAMFDKSNWVSQPGLRGTWNKMGRDRWLQIADAALDALDILPVAKDVERAGVFAYATAMMAAPGDHVAALKCAYAAMVATAREGK